MSVKGKTILDESPEVNMKFILEVQIKYIIQQPYYAHCGVIENVVMGY